MHPHKLTFTFYISDPGGFVSFVMMYNIDVLVMFYYLLICIRIFVFWGVSSRKVQCSRLVAVSVVLAPRHPQHVPSRSTQMAMAWA